MTGWQGDSETETVYFQESRVRASALSMWNPLKYDSQNRLEHQRELLERRGQRIVFFLRSPKISLFFCMSNIWEIVQIVVIPDCVLVTAWNLLHRSEESRPVK